MITNLLSKLTANYPTTLEALGAERKWRESRLSNTAAAVCASTADRALLRLRRSAQRHSQAKQAKTAKDERMSFCLQAAFTA